MLALSDDELEKRIHPVDAKDLGLGHRLEEATLSKWRNLEDPLLIVAEKLLTKHPKSNEFPSLSYPRMPHEFGYREVHLASETALQKAKCARDAFTPLTAILSFLLTLWLTPFEDTALDRAMAVLEESPEPLPRVWLQYLAESVVCDLSGGLRPGGFVNPYQTQWSPGFGRFPRARVPLWLLWGPQPRWSTETLHPYTRQWYFPPQEYVDGARDRVAEFASIILPLQENYHHDPAPFTATQDSPDSPPPASPSHLPPTSPLHQSAVQTFEWFGSGTLQTACTPPVEEDRTQIIPFGSRQRPGEYVEDFIKRREIALQKSDERLTDRNERRSRDDRIAGFEKGEIPRGTTVFLWERDPVLPSWYVRTCVAVKTDARNKLLLCSKKQRRYWADIKELDLFPHVHDAEHEAMVANLDDPNHPHYNFLYSRKPLMKPGKLAMCKGSTGTADEALKVIRAALLDVISEGINATPYQFWSLCDYVKLRHGLDLAELGTIRTAYLYNGRETQNLEETDMEKAVKRLAYAGVVISPEETASLVEFHNICLSANDSSTIKYADLPGTMDLSPKSPRLITRQSSRIKVEIINRGRKPTEGPIPPPSLFLLKPALTFHRFKDKSKWFVATPDATVVLLVLRMRWESMTVIARELLARGIPFRTVEERFRAPLDHPRSGSYGLGSCKEGFQATSDDYLAYVEAKNRLLSSTQGRAVRLVGGLVGRIAAEVVPEVRVLEGPAVGDEVVGFQDDKVYVDDLVLESSLDVVAGVYHVRVAQERANRVALKSFWPRHSTFIKSGIYCSQWLPDAEAFYQDRVDVLQSDEKRNLLTSSEWHPKMKKEKNNPRILAGSARLAADFVRDKIL